MSHERNPGEHVAAAFWITKKLISMQGFTVEESRSGYSAKYYYGDGYERVKKTENNKTTLYFFPEYEEEYTGTSLTATKVYYFLNGQRVAQRINNTLEYLHQDHLGSTILVTDNSGNPTSSDTYRPYGSSTTGNLTTNYQWTGGETDQSGLYYFNARYYSPETGRFISVDPAVIMKMDLDLSIEEICNPYMYARNNPIKYTDPTGLYYIDYSLSPGNRTKYEKTITVSSHSSSSSRSDKEKSLNETFAQTMVSLVGTPYLYGGNSRTGIDCSGTIIFVLSEMGYIIPDATAAQMASGNLDWLHNMTADESRAGNAGVLNFYKFSGSTNVSHVNIGVGRHGTPAPLLNPANQIVDATEGSTLNSRQGNPKQYKPPNTGQVNQTYTPYSTNTAPSSQAILNWYILERKYKRPLP